MNRKHLTALFTAASLSFTAGCASGWPKSLSWSRTKPGSESTAEYSDESDSSAKTASFLKRKPASDALSPEFKAAQKNLKNPEKSLLAWARYQEDNGEYAEARRKYRELQIAYPDNLDASIGLARIEMLTGRTRQAEEQLTALSRKHPDNGDIQTELGALYSRNENFPGAIRAYQRACEIDPDNESYRYELGIALVKDGQYDEGLSHLAFAVGDSAAHYNIGYILHEQGDDQNAIEWFRNSLELHPDKQTAERAEAMLATLQGTGRSSSDQQLARNASMKRSAGRGTSSDAATNSRSSTDAGRATLSNVSTPLPTVEEEPALSTSTTRFSQTQGTPLPPATDSYALPQVSGGRNNTESKPFRPVSWSPNQPSTSAQQGTASPLNASRGAVFSDPSALSTVAEPPQWGGPTGRTSQATSTSNGVQSPPTWRAHQGQ